MTGSGRTVIVTPVYEDRDAAAQLFAELVQLPLNSFIVAVDDGSVRMPLEVETLAEAGAEGAVIRLTRNVGHQRAIAVGLSYVVDNIPDAARVIVMDSDGEDEPGSISGLIDDLDRDDVDIVVAKREKRTEPLRFRIFYLIYKFVFQILTGHEINFGNFMALTPQAARRVTCMQELWIHVAGCVLVSKLRIAKRSTDRGSRYSGSSKMNFAGLVLHGFRAFMVFAEDILVRSGLFCVFVAAFSIVGIAATFILKLIGFATPGWFSISLGLLILILFQTGALTLISLLLTGLVRAVNPPIAYKLLIADVSRTRD